MLVTLLFSIALAALGSGAAALGGASHELRFTSSDGVELAGTLWLPEGAGPHPGIVFVQGRSYGSREQFSDHAERAAGRGVAGFVFDGRGVGGSGGERGKHTLEDRLADAAAAFELVRGHPPVDPDRVGLLGHSAGGWVVPVHDSAAELRSTRIPLLALYGGDDWIVPPEVNVPALEEALVAAGNTRFEIIVFPDANHSLEIPDQRYPPDYWETLFHWLEEQWKSSRTHGPEPHVEAAGETHG